MRVLLFFIVFILLQACSKPIDQLKPLNRIALISVQYDPNIYYFHPHTWVDPTKVYAAFSGEPWQFQMHETILNEFLTDLMSQTVKYSDISIVRPLKLLNTSLMKDDKQLHYEYLLDPYDPIDISNRVFMAGLAQRLNVDAVVALTIRFSVHLDEKMLWEEYKDPYARTLNAQRIQLKQGHETSLLKTEISLTVVDSLAVNLYEESRFVLTDSDNIHVDDRDLSFDGGVSPKLLRLGLDEWLKDWTNYLPKPLP